MFTLATGDNDLLSMGVFETVGIQPWKRANWILKKSDSVDRSLLVSVAFDTGCPSTFLSFRA